MKQIIILSCILLFQFDANAQKLYGIVRKNFYTLVNDPLDTTFTPYERFDSATIRLGELNTTNGFVSNVGQEQYNDLVNLTGAALNPFDNSFVFVGQKNLNTFDLKNGLMINSAPISNAIASSYFDNFRFSHSDSNLYGLARRVLYNPITGNYTGEVYLANIDTKTGQINQISPNSIAPGYALAGSAIDPFQMVYYFSTGTHLMGVDLYSGNVYSKVEINIPGGGIFDNFSYSCADNSLYGLVRKNYFSYYPNPINPSDSVDPVEQLDSSTVRLAKIDPNTGSVNILSADAVSKGGYSMNAGSAIDPQTMTFYYNTGKSIVGVSLYSGLKTSEQLLSFEEGDYFDLMRNFENCKTASAKRLANGNIELANQLQIQVYPNPANTAVQLETISTMSSVELTDMQGKQVMKVLPQSTHQTLDLNSVPAGLYIVQANTFDGKIARKKLMIVQ